MMKIMIKLFHVMMHGIGQTRTIAIVFSIGKNRRNIVVAVRPINVFISYKS